MIIFGGMLVGAILGAVIAKRNGGKVLDMLQYAAGFGIALSVLGLFITIILNRI